MIELNIYNSNFELVGVVDGFSSLRWIRRFYEIGEFELHCPASIQNMNILKQNNIIHRTDRLEAGLIEGIEISNNNETGDELIVTGRFLSCLLSQRIITPTINFNGTYENAMRQIVNDNAITNRAINNLILGTLNNFTDTVTFQATWKQLPDVLTALSKSSNIGYRIRYDVPDKEYVFETYKGQNKTVNQTLIPYVLFSDDFNNISSPNYTYNNQLYKNFAYVGGQGEGADRIVVTIDLSNGQPKRELWVDAKNQSQGTLSLDDYKAQLIQFGKEQLLKCVESESFESKIINTTNFEYRINWDLGDIVSFEKWGIILNEIVSEVEEDYEDNVETITPTFGSPIPETFTLGDDT